MLFWSLNSLNSNVQAILWQNYGCIKRFHVHSISAFIKMQTSSLGIGQHIKCYWIANFSNSNLQRQWTFSFSDIFSIHFSYSTWSIIQFDNDKCLMQRHYLLRSTSKSKLCRCSCSRWLFWWREDNDFFFYCDRQHLWWNFVCAIHYSNRIIRVVLLYKNIKKQHPEINANYLALYGKVWHS